MVAQAKISAIERPGQRFKTKKDYVTSLVSIKRGRNKGTSG